MFLEHGFDGVRVADVARACGVTEKTVFNHFRTKESLLADRWDVQTQSLRTSLADPSTPPLAAALEVLHAELGFLTNTASVRSSRAGLAQVRRYGDLMRSSPSLMAHNREALERLTAAVAAALATRTGSRPDDPELMATAAALTGLWIVFASSLHRHLQEHVTADEDALTNAVRRDLQRAAALLQRGI